MSISSIDVHTHILPSSYLAALDELGVSTFEEDGFPEPSWSEEAHLDFVEQTNQAFEIVSISSPHIHKGDDALAARLARAINDETAALCRRHPDKFGFAALLPLPAVNETIAEIARAYDELGAIGVKVPSNAHGVYFGDPVLDPVLQALDERHAVVTIHPCAPTAVPEGIFTAGPKPLFEFLADTTRLVINLITCNVISRYPNIRWVVPHCGSFLPEVTHRLMGIAQILGAQGLMEPVDVQGALRALYFDVAGNALPVMLPALLQVADPTHILYGSDFPYTPVPMIAQIKETLASDQRLAPYAQAIMHDNAAALYGLDA